VSPVLVFVGLLGVAFLGGFGRRGTFSLGLGAEYLVAGMIVGPAILGLVNRETLNGFQPLIVMGLGWLAAVVALRHGTFAGKFVGRKVYWSGFLASSLNVVLVGVGAYFLATKSGLFGASDARVFAVVIGSALCGTSDGGGHSAQGAGHRHFRLRSGLGNAAMAPPLLILAGVIAVAPLPVDTPVPIWAWALAGPVLGIVFGVTVAALLGNELRYGEFWPVFVGAVLLSSGLSVRFRVPLLTTAFALGLCVAALSPLRSKVRVLVQKTEAPLLLPLVVLGGALAIWPTTRTEWQLIFSIVVLRFVVHYLTGRGLASAFRSEGVNAHDMSMSLLPLGSLGLGVAAAVSFRQPGQLGASVLVSTCVVAVLGDLLGARALDRLFGKLDGGVPSLPPAADATDAEATAPVDPKGGQEVAHE